MPETDIHDVHIVTYVCSRCGQEFSEDVKKSTNFELLVCTKCGNDGDFRLRNISIRKEARGR